MSSGNSYQLRRIGGEFHVNGIGAQVQPIVSRSILNGKGRFSRAVGTADDDQFPLGHAISKSRALLNAASRA